MSAAPKAHGPRLPYGRQWIEDDDVDAVVSALRSDMIAHGPRTELFEKAFAAGVGAAEAVAVSSGTAALHLTYLAVGLGPGRRCVAPAVTFLATASAALMCGAAPVFADVDPETGLMTPQTLAAALADTSDVRLVVPVHLGGRLCDVESLAAVAETSGARLVEDASHAVGGTDANGRAVGSCAFAAAATFSFHPVKTMAAGEGGMVTLNDADMAARLRRLRNHGVTREDGRLSAAAFGPDGRRLPWIYEQLELGFNYRMNELEAALGLSQLGKLSRFVERRARLSARYDELLQPLAPLVQPTPRGPGRPGLHLYGTRIDFEAAGVPRAEVMDRLDAAGISTQVHYIPLYRQPTFGGDVRSRALPGAEAYYARTLSLPLFPRMSDSDPDRVVEALARALRP